MASPTRGFLDRLGKRLHLETKERQSILAELQNHIEDRTDDLVELGVPAEEALDHAIQSLGEADLMARRFYEIHARGSWHHTALAVLPHLLLSLMFALHLWVAPVWLALMMAVSLTITVVGWRKGRPRWTYPWLGYCLMAPIVSWGLAMSAVGYGAWGIVISGALPLGIPIYAASFAYIAGSLWIVIRVVSKAVRPDWIMASLAVVPIPFLAYWTFYFYSQGGLLESRNVLNEVDSSAAAVFLVLAASTAAFFRIGRRVVRVALLVITAPSMIILAWLSYQGGPGYIAVFLFSAVSLAMLLSPLLFDRARLLTEVDESAALVEEIPKRLPG